MSVSNKMLSKTLLLLLVVYSVSDYSYGQRDKKFFRKDYKYIESAEGFYKVHTLHKNWFEAKKQCANEGASLFYPEDENEFQAVASFWTSSQPFEWIFVGISDLVAKGVFETIDGRPVSNVYNNWAPGEPNNAFNGEDCVVLKKDGVYNDDNCSSKFPYICKKSLQSLQWNLHCNIPNLGRFEYDENPTNIMDPTWMCGSLFNQTLGRCYKLHRTPLSWLDAYAVCAAEQSYLTVINSLAEAEFVVRLAEGIQVNQAAGSYLRGAIHSGFHNRLNEDWTTAQGTSLAESGYDCWDDKQPGGGQDELCGSLFFNGRLNDISCDTKSIFVCEHDVDTLSSHFDDRFGEATVTY